MDIVYTEHCAGSFVDGIQVCIYCGKVLSDYTGRWASDGAASLHGWPEGLVWQTGVNPLQTTTIEPLVNYGGDDPHYRTIVKCTDKK